MKIEWTKGSRRAVVLVGVLLIVLAGVGMVTLGSVATTNPFTVSDSSTDTATSSGGEDAADEGAASTDEEDSATPPPETAESDPDPSDDRAGDDESEDHGETGNAENSDAADNGSEADYSEDDESEDGTGVNFVPGVSDFSVSTEAFDESSPDVEDGFVPPGEHRLLRFDMIIYNVGDADAELGRPEDRPDLFEYSESHGHSHLKGFNNYVLLDESGERTGAVRKQTFCLRDLYQASSNASSDPQFDCEYQGISAGWADEYDSSLPGQYIVIDDLPDGEYTLRATTNAAGTIDETCDDDNTVRVDLRITGDTVTVHTPRNHHVRPSAC